MTREDVLSLLWERADRYVSGEEISARLGVSRAAVWKAVAALRKAGYVIGSAPNRGYILHSDSDVLSEAGIRRWLRCGDIAPRVYDTIPSTNTALKAMAAEGAPAGLALVAAEQTAGRGRMGRSFYSPADSGLYLSLLLRPEMRAPEAVRLTAAAAVAAAETIEELSGRETQIKWVNDIYMEGRKVCGILTEASIDCENAMMRYVVVGLGVNLRVPEGDFPAELRAVAGAVFGSGGVPELRCRLAAGILDRLWEYTARAADPEIFARYRRRSFLLGREINVLLPGREPVRALAEDLNDDYSLHLRLGDGSERDLSSGEVSVREADALAGP